MYQIVTFYKNKSQVKNSFLRTLSCIAIKPTTYIYICQGFLARHMTIYTHEQHMLPQASCGILQMGLACLSCAMGP
jgi:hypothetical protein